MKGGGGGQNLTNKGQKMLFQPWLRSGGAELDDTRVCSDYFVKDNLLFVAFLCNSSLKLTAPLLCSSEISFFFSSLFLYNYITIGVLRAANVWSRPFARLPWCESVNWAPTVNACEYM